MRQTVILLLCVFACQFTLADEALVPQIEGEWWSVADNPDLGDYTSEKQQPVDFGIWQAADGVTPIGRIFQGKFFDLRQLGSLFWVLKLFALSDKLIQGG